MLASQENDIPKWSSARNATVAVSVLLEQERLLIGIPILSMFARTKSVGVTTWRPNSFIITCIFGYLDRVWDSSIKGVYYLLSSYYCLSLVFVITDMYLYRTEG